MKKLKLALILLVALALVACGQKQTAPSENNNTPAPGAASGSEAPAEEVTLTVAASPVPHAELLNLMKDQLKEEGVNLVVKEFTDYVQPNIQVDEKQMDANFFQHLPYLEQFNQDKGTKLVSLAGIHIEPFGAYSKKVTSIDELADGAQVAIPNDATNGGRALLLLAQHNIIKLKEGVGIAATVNDIVENEKNLKFTELEAAMLPRALDDVDLALINTNYALEAELVPTEDAVLIGGNSPEGARLIEDKESPYVNILVAREDNKDSEAIQKLVKALQSPEVKAFIETEYQGNKKKIRVNKKEISNEKKKA